MNTMAFFHDHVFHEYEGSFFSPGKLTYDNMSFYRSLFDNVVVVGRSRKVAVLEQGSFASTGPGLSVIGIGSLSSFKGFLHKKKALQTINSVLDRATHAVVRLPSEIGIAAFWEARKRHVPVLVEVVASAYDCLYYRGDILAKFYAPVLDVRVKQVLKRSKYSVYVTSEYLQSKYPSFGESCAVSDVELVGLFVGNRQPLSRKIKFGIIANPDLAIKGVRHAISALVMLERKGYAVQLEVVGGDGAILSNKVGIPDFVKFVGVVSNRQDLIAWLDSLDVYVQPSLTEGMPRSLIEAMSRGLPVVASRVGGIPELVARECLFEPGQPHDILKVLEGVLSNPSLLNKLSKTNLDKAQQFSQKALYDKRLRFFNKFLQD